ncbi:hypothetical protein [uncultured Rhodoferax sp.]|uniref:hypothetical protein n=1 Tax=uncultured Rhodoferax sp. TaxID=223188 RepID=UPI0025E443B9|nr:hypothetical protein [uncultured Rhodoferax sp.]
MEVIAHRPHVWFLAQEADNLYLDVNCTTRNRTADFSLLIRLTQQEELLYREGGEISIDQLAERIQGAADTLFASRHLGSDWESKLLNAIDCWKSKDGPK